MLNDDCVFGRCVPLGSDFGAAIGVYVTNVKYPLDYTKQDELLVLYSK